MGGKFLSHFNTNNINWTPIHQTVKHTLPSPPHQIRSFAIILILLLVPLNCWWVVASTLRVRTSPTQVSLFFNAIFTTLVLLGITTLFKKGRALINRLPVLNRAELLTIYTCVSIGSGLAGVDRLLVLIPLPGHAHWFASPENDWVGLFHRYIPQWLVISDKRILEGYHYGVSTLYTSTTFWAWVPVVLWWSAFIVALHLVMLCINIILRKQWVESERLSYPIIQLPLEMTQPRGIFFRSPWMWFGLGIGATIDIINGLNFLFPAVPSLGGKLYDLRRIFTERPLNAIGWSPIAIFPFGVGLSFFIPLDLSYSCWVFWLIWRAERILGGIMGWRTLPRFPYEAEQSHGAYLGLCVVALWMSRRHLKQVLVTVGGKSLSRHSATPVCGKSLSHTDEPIPYSLALIGLILGMTFIGGFCSKLGMSLWVIAVFFIIWLAISIAITRLRAELGSPVHDLHFIGPDEMMPRMFGIRRLGAANLTGFSYLYFLNRAHRSHAMPHQLEGFKLADGARSPLRRLAILMMFASALGAVSSFWAFLSLGYWDGGPSGFGRESFNRLERWLNYSAPPEGPALGFAGVGFGLTLLLAAMRMRFLWWNLHPVGYAISGSWAINPMVGSIFVGWLMKWIVLRYGGLRWHRAAIPFFLGLVLGEFLIGTFWSVCGIILDQPMYRFLF